MLSDKAAAHVRGVHGPEHGRGPFGQGKEELPLGQCEFGRRIELAALGCVEQGKGAGHDGKGMVGKRPFSDTTYLGAKSAPGYRNKRYPKLVSAIKVP